MKNFKQLSTIVLNVLIISVLCTTSITNTVGAIYDEQFFAGNDILFYDPDDNGCPGGRQAPGNASIGASTVEDTESNKHIFQSLVDGGLNGVQAAAVMGNMWHESRFNSDAHEVGNDIGYGLVQWSFGRRTNLEAFAKEKGVENSNVDMQIEFLFKEYNSSYKKRLKGSDFEKAEDIGKATESWMMIFEVPKMAPANDPAALNSDRIPSAIKIYEFYKEISPSKKSKDTKTDTIKPTVSVSTVNCGTGNGAVAGSIIETALNFALQSPAPNGTTAESDARDTYRAAKPIINPSSDWTDCGGFVATVMRASGVDPDYPLLGVHPNQEPYVRNNPDKYLIIEDVNSAGDLQPGDILMTEGHTVIYTGRSNYPVVDASLSERVPSVQTSGNISWMIDNDTIAVRIIK